MIARLGTIIIASLFILLNIAHADIKPFIGIGAVGQNAFHNWCVDELFHDTTPPVFSTGLHFEAGMKWKQLELYAGYRSTNSQTQSNYYSTFIDYTHFDNTYYFHSRDYTKEESWGERDFLVGMRYRLTSKEYPVVPFVGLAAEIGEDINRWHSRELDQYDYQYYDDSDQYIGSDHYERVYSEYSYSKRVPSYGGQIEIGVEWKIVEHTSMLILAQFGNTETENEGRFFPDQVFIISQLFQLRYTL
jgi:hypothetical protein